MTPVRKRSQRTLILRREELRRLDPSQLRLVEGGDQVYTAGACTETCTGCQQTTLVASLGCDP